MDGITPALLLKALDGHALRAAVIAQNIANAGTPGYRPAAVSFEEALAAAAPRGAAAVAKVLPQVVPALQSTGQARLRLDLELADAASNAGRYAALAELLNRHLQIEALAVTGLR